jgi:hypothetical protein
VPVSRLALAGAAAVTALALSGCSQPSAANDNTDALRRDRTTSGPTIIRTPVRVPSPEATVPQPGPTGGAPGAVPNQSPTP